MLSKVVNKFAFVRHFLRGRTATMESNFQEGRAELLEALAISADARNGLVAEANLLLATCEFEAGNSKVARERASVAISMMREAREFSPHDVRYIEAYIATFLNGPENPQTELDFNMARVRKSLRRAFPMKIREA